jgi:hypothetical protein
VLKKVKDTIYNEDSDSDQDVESEKSSDKRYSHINISIDATKFNRECSRTVIVENPAFLDTAILETLEAEMPINQPLINGKVLDVRQNHSVRNWSSGGRY